MKARKVRGVDAAAPLAEGAARIIAVRLDELVAFAPKAFDPGQARALDDMRIAARRLRDVLEVAGDLFGPDAGTARERTKELQALLGDIHDCDLLEPRVLALLEDLREEDAAAVVAGGEPRHADEFRGLELLIVRTRARRRQLFERFLASWTDLEREGFRARLQDAIGDHRGEEAAA